jgi:hypothetical protein|tara:strand:+ start:2388 stop:2573 length:186 start_codon:yes stop_codon:yes gene_type:complete
MDELITIDFILFAIGVSIMIFMILYVLVKELPAGTKGITDEYTSKSGVKRTAKKEREDHIV